MQFYRENLSISLTSSFSLDYFLSLSVLKMLYIEPLDLVIKEVVLVDLLQSSLSACTSSKL